MGLLWKLGPLLYAEEEGEVFLGRGMSQASMFLTIQLDIDEEIPYSYRPQLRSS